MGLRGLGFRVQGAQRIMGPSTYIGFRDLGLGLGIMGRST